MIQPKVFVSNCFVIALFLFHSGQPLFADEVDLPLNEIRSAQIGSEGQMIERVVELFRSGDAAIAQTFAIEHAQANPDSASGLLLVASAMIRLGNVPGATQALEQFAKSDSDGKLFEVSVGYAVLARSQQRYADAWAHCLVASTASPPSRWSAQRSATAKLNLETLMATVCLERQWWTEARARFEKLEQVNPESAEIVFGSGVAAFRLGQVGVAVEKIKRSSELSPDLPSYRLTLARLHASAGDLTEAERWFREGIGQDAERVADAYLGWLIDQNRPDDVLKLYAKLPQEVSQSDSNRYWFALANRMKGQFVQAEQVLSDLHQQLPSNQRLSNQLALVLVESTSEEKRARALQIATANARRSQTSEILATLGWIQFRTGEPEQAEKTMVVALRSGSISRDAAYFLAEIQESLGKTEESQQIRKQIESATGPFFYAYRK